MLFPSARYHDRRYRGRYDTFSTPVIRFSSLSHGSGFMGYLIYVTNGASPVIRSVVQVHKAASHSLESTQQSLKEDELYTDISSGLPDVKGATGVSEL